MKKPYSLVGVDGNAFSVMSYVQRAMRTEKVEKKSISKYLKDATSGDYEHLISVSARAIEKLNKGEAL